MIAAPRAAAAGSGGTGGGTGTSPTLNIVVTNEFCGTDPMHPAASATLLVTGDNYVPGRTYQLQYGDFSDTTGSTSRDVVASPTGMISASIDTEPSETAAACGYCIAAADTTTFVAVAYACANSSC